MVFRNIDRRMSLYATGPARLIPAPFRPPSPCSFCYKLFSRGWVSLPKHWVSARFPLVSWRAVASGSDAIKPVVRTYPDFERCADATDVSYFTGQQLLRATHLHHRSAGCRTVPMVLPPKRRHALDFLDQVRKGTCGTMAVLLRLGVSHCLTRRRMRRIAFVATADSGN